MLLFLFNGHVNKDFYISLLIVFLCLCFRVTADMSVLQVDVDPQVMELKVQRYVTVM